MRLTALDVAVRRHDADVDKVRTLLRCVAETFLKSEQAARKKG